MSVRAITVGAVPARERLTPMGHRALVAYQRGLDGKYNLHYSHWGASGLALQERITRETPLGGDNDLEPPHLAQFVQALAEATDADEVGGRIAEAQETQTVDGSAKVIGADIDGVMDELDNAWYEAVFFVRPEGDEFHVRGYHVLSDLRGEYLLVAPRWWGGEPVSLGHDRGWFKGVKDQYADLADEGLISEDEANERLLAATLERYADNLHKVVAATSPAITNEHMNTHPEAFLRMGGRTRVLGEMYPTRVKDADPWELPDDFPAVKTADGEAVNPA